MKYQTASEVPFEYVVQFMEHASKAPSKKKGEHLEAFRKACVPRQADDIFQIYRLLLPHADRVRPNYMLKEAKLVELLVKALNVSGDEAKKAQNWKDVGTKGAGDFPRVMYEYLLKRNCSKREGTAEAKVLTVGQVNEWLDKLAADAEGEAPKAWNARRTEVLRWLVTHTTPTQMKWILSVILKNVKISMGEDRILKDFHVDALHLYNLSTDLQRVCQELKDPNKRLPRKDVEPGAPIRPQLCLSIMSVDSAHEKMKGKEFVCEVKIDGERMQVHRSGSDIKYFSRRAREHGKMSEYNMFDSVVAQQVKAERCILDGELVVWNKVKKVFEPFGGLKSAMYAARDRKDSQERIAMRGMFDDINTCDPDYESPMVQDIEIVYVCFDVLFVGNESVINRPLRERQQILRRTVADAPAEGILLGGFVYGRIVLLLPDVDVLNDMPFARAGTDKHLIQEMYDRALEKQEEGIVVKALDSEWKLNDRSGSWLKLKPDYVEVADVDALVIGGLYGTGRHGGQVSEWVLALADAPAGVEPSRFVSFCRVGTGMDDATLQQVRTKLAPYWIKNNGRNKPKAYCTTGSAKERPDLWVSDPMHSVVLQIKADIRTITSETFAAQQSLRFPRVVRVRWDKQPVDTTTEEEVIEQVMSGKGSLGAKARQQRKLDELQGAAKPKQAIKRATVAARGGVVARFRAVDVSGVERVSSILEGRAVYIHNTPGATPADKDDSRHRLACIVARLGGELHLQYSSSVDYTLAAYHDYHVARCAAQEAKGQATHDVISTAWLEEVNAAVDVAASEGVELEVLPQIMPRHYLFLSYVTRIALAADMSIHGAPYTGEVLPVDVTGLLKHLMYQPELARTKKAAAAAAAGERAEHGPPADERTVAARDYFASGPVANDLRALGLLNAKRTLFRRCNLLFVDANPVQQQELMEQHQQELQQGSVEQEVHGRPRLLAGVQEAVDAALVWQQRSRDNETKELALQVLLHGGAISQSLNSKVTHIVLRQAPQAGDPCCSDHCAPPGTPKGGPIAPLLLLRALKAAAGSDVRALYLLRQDLLAGRVHFVRHGWAQDSLAALEQNGSDARRKSELLYAPLVAGTPSAPGTAGGGESDAGAGGASRRSGTSLRERLRQLQHKQEGPTPAGTGRQAHSGSSSVEPPPSASQHQADLLNVAAWPWKEVGVSADVAKKTDAEADTAGTAPAATKRGKRSAAAARAAPAKRRRGTAIAPPEDAPPEDSTEGDTHTEATASPASAKRGTAAVRDARAAAAKGTKMQTQAARKRPSRAAAAPARGRGRRGRKQVESESAPEEEEDTADSSESEAGSEGDGVDEQEGGGVKEGSPPRKRARPQRQAARKRAVIIDESSPSEGEQEEEEEQQQQQKQQQQPEQQRQAGRRRGKQGSQGAALGADDDLDATTGTAAGAAAAGAASERRDASQQQGTETSAGGSAATTAALPSAATAAAVAAAAPAAGTKRRLPALPGVARLTTSQAAAPYNSRLSKLLSQDSDEEAGELAPVPARPPVGTNSKGSAGASQQLPSAASPNALPIAPTAQAVTAAPVAAVASHPTGPKRVFGNGASKPIAGPIAQAAQSRLSRLLEMSDDEDDEIATYRPATAAAAPAGTGAAVAAVPTGNAAASSSKAQAAATLPVLTGAGMIATHSAAPTKDSDMPYTRAAKELLYGSQSQPPAPVSSAHASTTAQNPSSAAATAPAGPHKLPELPVSSAQQGGAAAAAGRPKVSLASRVAKFLPLKPPTDAGG